MCRILLLLLVTIFTLDSCQKKMEAEEDKINGIWVREGTNGIGPGNTLNFSRTNNNYTLKFDCSGSPGPGWPSTATTAYQFNNGKLTYLNYYDNRLGYYTADTFKWIVPGQEFEIQFSQLLLFMSATYVVKYQKIN